MITKMKNMNRRGFCAVGAVVVALALIITGVFAWFDNHQHKSNLLKGGNKINEQDVVLIEDFEAPPDWYVDEELKKEVSVKNTGDGQMYIRIQLKEYMDIAKVEYEYTDERLMVDKDGKFMYWADEAAAKEWLTKNKIPFTDAQLVRYTAYGDTAERVYFATGEDTPLNGRDGKKMLLDYIENAPEPLVPGTKRGTYSDTNDHQLNQTDECKYPPHLWSGSAFEVGKDSDPNKDPFHEYVKWTLGPKPTLIKMSTWNGEPVAAWILDDTSAEGWAYWGEALRPGDSTTKLLEAITLIKQPDGPFYYALHVDMQAADIYDLDKQFKNMPEKIQESYHGRTGFVIIPNVQVVAQGGEVKFDAYWNGKKLGLENVIWTVAGSDATLGALTKFDAPGILTISPLQPLGKLIVTAAYDDIGSGLTKTSQYIITVKSVPPPTTANP